MVGAWLTEDIYHQTVGDDASFLLKGSANGISDIVLVETTAVASSQNISFEEAATMAQRELKEENRFELFIDVYRCRLDKIRPLPQRINHNGEWQIENSGIEHENVTQRIHQLDRYEIKLEDSKDEITKQIIWERKLLDFSLRNNLINIRLGRRVIPFISFEIDHLEDHLQAGENYQILPSPAKSKIEPGETGLYDSSLWKGNLEKLVISELRNKKLRSYLTESELQNSLKFVYRTSRTAIEENGANSLFLVLGVLKWYESSKSVKPRFAPILLLPVDIVRRGGLSGYIIRTRDEEIILNITLVELLKQQFNVNLSRQNGSNPILVRRFCTTESAAIFSATNSTRFPLYRALAIILVMVCDLPVPGGPCNMKLFPSPDSMTASSCEESTSTGMAKLIGSRFLSISLASISGAVSCHRMRFSIRLAIMAFSFILPALV